MGHITDYRISTLFLKSGENLVGMIPPLFAVPGLKTCATPILVMGSVMRLFPLRNGIFLMITIN